MDPTGGRDSRYNLNYSMSMLGDSGEIYGNPNVSLARPPSGGALGQVMSRSGGLINSNAQCGSLTRGLKRTNSECFDERAMGSQTMGMDGCPGAVQDVVDEGFTSLQQKKSPPSNGKKTKGRVKIKMEYIDNKLRRYTTFSKRKTGIMKKAYELSTLTGTQVMLLVASETGHVYTFATRKLQPMITSEAGKALIQTCLNSPDPPSSTGAGDQRMSATGFEETELSYNIGDEDSKDGRSPLSSGESDDSSGADSPAPSSILEKPPSTSATSLPKEAPPKVTPPVIAPATSAPQIQAGLGSVLYPAAALANLPQDVLLSLVQAGHLQFHSNDDGGHQYITIPLTTTAGSTPPALTKLSTVKQESANGRDSPLVIKKESVD
ncbi:serum response factor homolog isoform X1 [Phlebotomus argentipes]|uniref:serum response factor homolog isoform X1 n=1 Tax=Phlebotomus argentipes TaxID=94469 RepID=UPI0028931AC0|nr:serum response factor homolog isoform X1 [Phlebotomus argentipes]